MGKSPDQPPCWRPCRVDAVDGGQSKSPRRNAAISSRDHPRGQGRDPHRHARVQGRRAERGRPPTRSTTPWTSPALRTCSTTASGGASAYAIRKGFSASAPRTTRVVIFSELMDAKSLFLTANADTVYYMAVSRPDQGPDGGRAAAEGRSAPSTTCGSRWIIDIGFPGPDRGEGGKYLLVPPGYDGPLPEGGFFDRARRSTSSCYAARAFLDEQRSQSRPSS